VYLASFQPDPSFPAVLKELGVETTKLLVVVRPPARDALYHRFDNELFDELLGRLASRDDVKVILLPRTESQRRSYIESANLIVPSTALDGANLIAAADLVVSAGGTMNREAAALGVPAVTIYAGEWAAIDEALVQDGRLIRIRDREDLANLRVSRKPGSDARRNLHVRGEVAGLILDAI
jgi:predicted glycosyltransferase